jgi:hypothetical protein
MWYSCFTSLFLFLVLAINGYGQVNLVPNGGFEEFDWCPNSAGDFSTCDHWVTNVGSADYFHSCGLAGGGVPSNFAGYQNPHSGNAYAGVAVYTTSFSGGQESIAVDLSQPMQSGVKYDISLWISPWDNYNYHGCCIGIMFDQPPWPPFSTNLSVVELEVSSSNLDTSLWYQLDAEYVAQGGENVIYVGNFRPDSLTFPVYQGEITPDYNSAGFYIDDVEVYVDDLVSVVSDDLLEFSVTPNPFNQNLYIDFELATNDMATVQVFNMMGQRVKTLNDNSNHLGLHRVMWNGQDESGNPVSNGQYLVLITTPDHQVSKKVILNR